MPPIVHRALQRRVASELSVDLPVGMNIHVCKNTKLAAVLCDSQKQQSDQCMSIVIYLCLLVSLSALSVPALGMFELFGRTGPPILGGRLFGAKNLHIKINSFYTLQYGRLNSALFLEGF